MECKDIKGKNWWRRSSGYFLPFFGLEPSRSTGTPGLVGYQVVQTVFYKETSPNYFLSIYQTVRSEL
jgi:hypothetical protein